MRFTFNINKESFYFMFIGIKVFSGEVKEAIAMIESNPSLSAEQKAAMKAQMSQMQGMAGTEKELRAQVHPADIAVVKANEAALDEAME